MAIQKKTVIWIIYLARAVYLTTQHFVPSAQFIVMRDSDEAVVGRWPTKVARVTCDERNGQYFVG